MTAIPLTHPSQDKGTVFRFSVICCLPGAGKQQITEKLNTVPSLDVDVVMAATLTGYKFVTGAGPGGVGRISMRDGHI
jgi:hypothetical protein